MSRKAEERKIKVYFDEKKEGKTGCCRYVKKACLSFPIVMP
jgi:hypothetical protein